jgi:hypothetical protein
VIEACLVPQAITPVTPVINLDDKSINKQINGPHQLSEAPLQQTVKVGPKMTMKKMMTTTKRRRRNVLGNGNGTNSS